MKVLFFIDCLCAGGKERRLTELMKALKLDGKIDFELVTMSEEVYYKEIFNLDIKIHYLIRKRKKDISIFRKFYKICKNFKPDIIHCWDSMTAIYSIPACKLLNLKLVNGMVVDAPEYFGFFSKLWLRTKMAFLFSNVVVGNSKAGLNAYRAPQKKSTFIYNGFNFNRIGNIVSPEIIKNTFDIKSRYIVLMIGAFGERKDYDTYIKAAKNIIMKRLDIEFVAVGDGENFNRISHMIGAEYKEKIKLLGKQTDVESIINASDICVLTTNVKVHGEGISNSILEYMALGKPVVASSGGGTNEIVEDGKTGFLVTPLNPPELIEKIEILLDHPELRGKFGRAGQERVKEKFSINSMAKEYTALYNKII